ncbi:hypothetical protein ALC60_06781, partial [Trachymyrmex zeteki]
KEKKKKEEDDEEEETEAEGETELSQMHAPGLCITCRLQSFTLLFRLLTRSRSANISVRCDLSEELVLEGYRLRLERHIFTRKS